MLNRLKFKNHDGEDDDLKGLTPLETIARQIPRLRSEVRLARRSYRFTIGVVIGAIATGALLFWNDHIEDQEDAERDRQYISDQCERGNQSRKAIHDGFDQQRNVLVAASAPSDGVMTPARQRALDTYNAGIDNLLKEFAPRDCAAITEAATKGD